MSDDKTKVMCISNTQPNLSVVTGHEPTEEVQWFTCLGNVLSDDRDVTADVNCRISKVSAVFQKMRQI
jgi:hypothetical protein